VSVVPYPGGMFIPEHTDIRSPSKVRTLVLELYWAKRHCSPREVRTSVTELMGAQGLTLVILFSSGGFPSRNAQAQSFK